MTEISTVFKITAAVAGAEAVKQLGERIKQVSTTGENMQRTFAQGALVFAKWAGAAAAAATATFAFIKPTIDLADNLNDISQKTGVAVAELAKYAVAAKNSGTSIEQLAAGFGKLNKNLVEAQNGTGATAAALRAMGISLRDAEGGLKNADQITSEVADRFRDFPDGPQKAALAMALFGKAGADLIPLLNGGSAAMKEFSVDVDQEFASAADAFNDRIGNMGAGITNIGIMVAKVLLPAINSTIDIMNKMISGLAVGLIGIIQAVKAAVLEMAQFIKLAINALVIEPINLALKGVNAIAGTGYQIEGFKDVKIGGATSDAIDAVKSAYNRPDMFGSQAAAPAEAPKTPPSVLAAMSQFSGSAGADKAAAAMERATEAASDWLDKQRESIETLKMEADYIGRTTNEIEQMKEARKIMTEAQEKANKLSGEAKEKFLREAEAIAAMRKEVMQYNYEQSRTFGAGARSFLTKYAEDAANTAEQVKTALSTAFKGAEDALVNFVTTGKLNFRSFAQSLIADLARIAIQRTILGPIAGALGGLFGGGSTSVSITGGAFANGGIMSSKGPMPLRAYSAGGIANSPQMALFGEGSTPEAYVPLPDGRRIPVALQGGGGANVNVTVNMSGGTTTQSNSGDAGKLGTLIAASVKSILINEKRPGGLLAAM